jgi:hypothetical protein
MAAKFYTDAELKTARDKAVEIAAEGVASLYSDVGVQFGRALFFTCMRLWKSGPAVTCARLNSNIRPQIINAWHWSEPLSGVLLKKHDLDFIPLFLQTDKLAFLLTQERDLWISFIEIRKELGL